MGVDDITDLLHFRCEKCGAMAGSMVARLVFKIDPLAGPPIG